MESQWGDGMKDDLSLMGTVLRIERTSIHDGAGLRTVLFLKGCPLQCSWCSTPESQCWAPEKGYDAGRCIGCGLCVASCPTGALHLSSEGSKVSVDQAKCSRCFLCVVKCPHRAWKQYGSIMTVEEVIREIAKDEIFFFYSGGGVTVSGGEALSQVDFTAAVLRACGRRGIPAALETSCYAPWGEMEKILPFLQNLYVDLKLMDRDLHQQWVGVDNSLILDNIRRIDQSSHPVEIMVRIPLIPGLNDSDDNLAATGAFCRSLKKLKVIEILPYHRLGKETYSHLGRDYAFKELLPPSPAWILERAGFLAGQKPGVPVYVNGNEVA